MSARLPWKLLREAFAGEWVELVDYEWEWGAPVPRWGKVRSHASDRNSLIKIMRADEKARGDTIAGQESVILYVSPTPPSLVMLEPTTAVV